MPRKNVQRRNERPPAMNPAELRHLMDGLGQALGYSVLIILPHADEAAPRDAARKKVAKVTARKKR